MKRRKFQKRDCSPSVERLLKKLRRIQENWNKKGEKISPLDSGDNDINSSVSKDSGKL